MSIAQRGMIMCIFFVMSVLAGSAASWAQEEVITTESDQSIVVLELQAGQKVHLICKTEMGKKIWVFVNAPEIVPGMTYARPTTSCCFPLKKTPLICIFPSLHPAIPSIWVCMT